MWKLQTLEAQHLWSNACIHSRNCRFSQMSCGSSYHRTWGGCLGVTASRIIRRHEMPPHVVAFSGRHTSRYHCQRFCLLSDAIGWSNTAAFTSSLFPNFLVKVRVCYILCSGAHMSFIKSEQFDVCAPFLTGCFQLLRRKGFETILKFCCTTWQVLRILT